MVNITRSQWRAISLLSTNFSAVFLASLVLPVVTGNVDLSKWYVVILGVVLTIFFVWLTLVSAKEGKL